MSDRALVSIIVPALDEEAGVTGLLDHLAALPGRWEVILADGGSRDATPQLAAQHCSQPLIVDAPGGRASQMNAGAAAARGDVLMFLHADTRLPQDAHANLCSALADVAVLGGNFDLRFDGADRFSRVLGRWYALQRRAGVYYGDSAIWLRRTAFERLGGFRPLPIMEDYDLVRRLERAGTSRHLRAALAAARSAPHDRLVGADPVAVHRRRIPGAPRPPLSRRPLTRPWSEMSDRLDRSPWRPAHRRIAGALGIGWALDAFEVQIIGSLIPSIATDFHLSKLPPRPRAMACSCSSAF
jgi:glycosyltransferase involved in cell wall biosynthesis